MQLLNDHKYPTSIPINGPGEGSPQYMVSADAFHALEQYTIEKNTGNINEHGLTNGLPTVVRHDLDTVSHGKEPIDIQEWHEIEPPVEHSQGCQGQ